MFPRTTPFVLAVGSQPTIALATMCRFAQAPAGSGRPSSMPSRRARARTQRLHRADVSVARTGLLVRVQAHSPVRARVAPSTMAVDPWGTAATGDKTSTAGLTGGSWPE